MARASGDVNNLFHYSIFGSMQSLFSPYVTWLWINVFFNNTFFDLPNASFCKNVRCFIEKVCKSLRKYLSSFTDVSVMSFRVNQQVNFHFFLVISVLILLHLFIRSWLITFIAENVCHIMATPIASQLNI